MPPSPTQRRQSSMKRQSTFDASEAVTKFSEKKHAVPRLDLRVAKTSSPGPGAYTLPELPTGRCAVIQPDHDATAATSGRRSGRRRRASNASDNDSDGGKKVATPKRNAASRSPSSPVTGREAGPAASSGRRQDGPGGVAHSARGDALPSDLRPLKGTFDCPQHGVWTPRHAINGSSRSQRRLFGIDLYTVSQRPGPGQYFPSVDRMGMAGRDRTMRTRLPLERFNAGQFSVQIPIAAQLPRQ